MTAPFDIRGCAVCAAVATPGPRPSPAAPFLTAIIEVDIDGIEVVKAGLCPEHRAKFETWRAMRVQARTRTQS